jgi:hypothetical protein
MRMKLLTAVAAAAILSCQLAGGAAAAPIAARSALGTANAVAVEKAAVVCGRRGCVRVAPRYYRGYYNYYRPYGVYRPYGWYGRRWYWR